MKKYQVRVMKERKALQTKYNKLRDYMLTSAFDKLSSEDRELLVRQSLVMDRYGYILAQRIKRF